MLRNLQKISPKMEVPVFYFPGVSEELHGPWLPGLGCDVLRNGSPDRGEVISFASALVLFLSMASRGLLPVSQNCTQDNPNVALMRLLVQQPA